MSDQLKVLVIDDEAIARGTLEALLDEKPYDLFFAEDGLKGLAKVREIQPDVILLDIMMPGMNGYEVCKRIRSDLNNSEVPIIMLTALDDRDSKLNSLEAGADDFLTKPFDKLELDIRLHNIQRINRYRQLIEEREKFKTALQDLSLKNDELRTLSRQVFEAQENERRYVAVELHDEIGQLITGLRLVLDPNRQDYPTQISEARMITNELFQRVREMTLNLRPTALDDLGLFAALDDLFKRFTRQTKIAIHSKVNPMETQRFDKNIETAAFRVIQEALTNTARHAGVTEVSVIVINTPAQLQVGITDAGKGFDLDMKNPIKSTGLSGMAERVRLAGGRFSIRSKPGEGTLVLADFNLISTE
jgi:signal transduction histidine kinase